VRKLCAAALAAAALGSAAPAAAEEASANAPSAHHVLAIARDVKREEHLKAVILHVGVGRRTLVDTALGNSMNGVPATTRMNFRYGSIAIPDLTTVLLQLRDEGKLSLGDKLSKYFPAMPDADRVSLRMLASSTSGYYDYLQGNPAFEAELAANEFRQWKPRELLDIAFGRGMACAPGTCFVYSHANFILLGKVMRKVTGMRVRKLVRQRVLRPLGLHSVAISSQPGIPSPVLHSYSRRTAGGPYEDSTFWSPTWALGTDELMTGNIEDVARTAVAIGDGRLLSQRSYRDQTAPPDIGPPGPPPKSYFGLGVIVTNAWVIQNPFFNGYVGAMGYLPGRRISIAVESTYGGRTDDTRQWSGQIFDRIGAYLAPGHPPATPG
jgi:D-alanyl-D-alanine carboxypeptidase